MDTMRLCPQCSEALPPDSTDRICAKCQSDPARTTPSTRAGARPVPPTPAEIAQFFPQLEILELLGQGGMGMVYKARQPQLHRIVALKILSPDLSADPAFAERFSREARSLARLNHSNIVSIFDFGQAGHYYYLLMEHVDGTDLREIIHQQHPTPAEARRIAMEICQALHYAHEEGVVHRDIKPSNILIDKKGRVKIADFGLAKLNEKTGDAPALTTVVMGTPHYMAPEQIETPGNVDHRADLYSLGVVFYEMLTGELPLGRFEPPSVKNEAVDVRLDNMVLRALEKNRERRYQQAGDIRADLETTLTRPNPPATIAAAAPAKEPRRLGLLGQFGLMAGTALLAVFLFSLMTNRGPWKHANNNGRPPQNAPGANAGAGEGTMLGKRTIDTLHLTKPQIMEVTRVVRRYQREFAALERRHTVRTKDKSGHVHITISPFPDDMQQLMAQLWKDLTGTLSIDQIASAQQLNFERFFPNDGQVTVHVEVWRDASGEEHFVESEDPGPDNKPRPHRDLPAEMPPRYRAYLEDF